MTLAVGFKCSDGVVMSADSQFTGLSKRYAAKVWALPEQDERAVVALAGAGDAVLIRRARYDLSRKLKPGLSLREILQATDDVVYALWTKFVKDDEDATMSLLVAIRTADECVLFENQGGKALAPVDRGSQCIGSEGSILGLYFTDWLFDSNLPMSRARTVAAHLLKQAKEYDPNVGGESHILIFPADVTLAPYRIDRNTIAALETQLDYTKGAIRELIVNAGVPGVDMNRETAARRKLTLDTAVSAVHSHYLTLEPAHIDLTGTVSLLKIEGPPTELEGPTGPVSHDDPEELSGVVQPPPKPEDSEG